MKKIRLLVVDDHALVRDGIRAMLNTTKTIEIIDEATDGLEAIVKTEKLDPDVVLMDIIMPELNGIEAIKEIRKGSPDCRIILLSMEISEEFIAEALKSGVSGYIPKDVRRDTLIEAITRVHNGEEYFDPAVSEAIFKNYYKKKTTTSAIVPGSGKISPREEEILTLIGQGISNQEIADKLFISVKTVDAHRSHIMQKLGLKNTVELIKFAIKTGIIPM